MNTNPVAQPNVLLLGGSGFVGRAFCEQWLRAGAGTAAITVPTRRMPHALPLQAMPGITVIEADVHDPAQLRHLLAGQQVVVNLIGVLQGDAARFDAVHAELPRKLAEACQDTGVRRVVHISAIGASSEAPSQYLRSKAAGEAALHAAPLDLTILRPSVIFGDGDHFLNLFAGLQKHLPVLPLAGADARFQPVWVDDVACAIIKAVADPATIGHAYELAGPQEMSLAELAHLAGRIAGHERPVLPLPAALARIEAFIMETLPGEPLLSRDNLASMQVANVATPGRPGLAELGIRPQSIEAVAPEYLAPGQGVARLDEWRAKAH